MKRPEGFDRPAPSQTPVEKPAQSRASKPAQLRAPKPAQSTRPGAPGGDATTEPILIPSPPIPPDLIQSSPVQPDLIQSSPIQSDSIQPSPVQPPTLSPARTLSSAAARARLRAARRARKHYEREEVRRFTWRSRRRRRTWLVSLGVVAALVVFTLVGAYSPLMALRTVDVVGTSRIPAGDVQAALGDQLGTPLPLLDFDRIKRELSRFTLIRSYITESRPPGTLVVRIVEREPVGVLPAGAGFDLVDAAGVVIQSSPERPAGYPLIDAGGVGSPGFRAASEVVGALPERLRSQLDSVTAATTDDVTLSLAGGARVVWGSAAKSEYKAVVLAALIVGHPVGSVKEYDVSSPDSVVLR